MVKSFSVARAHATLKALSADEMAGRRLGTEGNRRAREWLTTRMTEIGLRTELIDFEVPEMVGLSRQPSLEVIGGGQLRAGPLEHRVDFAEHPRSAFSCGDRSGLVAQLDDRGNASQWVISPQYSRLNDLASRLAASGAAGILTSQRRGADGYLCKRILGGSQVPLPVIAVEPDVLRGLLGATIRASVPLRRIRSTGASVVGRISGSDPDLNNQPLIISAHFDGVGDDPDRRFPCAADNASGVAVMLEVGRVLAGSGRRPPRPIVLVALDGEEVGAIGSQVHAAALVKARQLPQVINLDMVARFHEAVAVEIGPGAERIATALDRAGMWMRIPLATSEVASDNRRYASAGIPAVGLGLGAANYHSPADTPDLVQDEATAVAGRLVLATAWQLCHGAVDA